MTCASPYVYYVKQTVTFLALRFGVQWCWQLPAGAHGGLGGMHGDDAACAGRCGDDIAGRAGLLCADGTANRTGNA